MQEAQTGKIIHTLFSEVADSIGGNKSFCCSRQWGLYGPFAMYANTTGCAECEVAWAAHLEAEGVSSGPPREMLRLGLGITWLIYIDNGNANEPRHGLTWRGRKWKWKKLI